MILISLNRLYFMAISIFEMEITTFKVSVFMIGKKVLRVFMISYS